MEAPQPDSPDSPRMEADTAPLKIAREYMESLGLNAPDPSLAPPPGKTTRPLRDPARVRRLLIQAVSQSERIILGAEARVELLVQALQSRGVAIPGVDQWELRHAVTANGRNIVTYLEKRFVHIPALEQQVQVACFRFRELVEATRMARELVDEGGADEELLEDVKRKTYFVTHYYDHFKDDPLLRQLFPQPAEPQRARTGQVGTDNITRYRQARDACGRRADALNKVFVAGLERAHRLIALAKQDRGSALLGMLNPNDMRERQVVKKLRETGQLAVLMDLVAKADLLPAMLVRVKDGAPYEPLEEHIEMLIVLVDKASADAHLKELVPVVPAELRSPK